MATDEFPAPPFDEDEADMPESYDSFWDAVPVDLSAPAPPAVEAPAAANPEPVAVHPAEVVSADRKRTVLTVLDGVPAGRELPFPLVVASALPKGDRADFLVEKLTELGVTRFVPLVTARAVVQPKDAKVEKFERAVIE